MRIYIAGPMTGLPNKNYMAFHARAELLRAEGHEVVSPAELWPLDAEGTWHEFLRKDIAAMLTCDAIYLLPGWQSSKGARLEQEIARRLDLFVIDHYGD